MLGQNDISPSRISFDLFLQMVPKLFQKHSKSQVFLANTKITVTCSCYLPFLLNVFEHFCRSRKTKLNSVSCLKQITVTFLTC